MISNTLLKIVSGVLLVIIVVVIAVEIAVQNPAFTPSRDHESSQSSLLSNAIEPSEKESAEQSNLALETADENESMADGTISVTPLSGRLVPGRMGATPQKNEIVTIQEIPWLKSQINRSFRDAETAACSLLTPGLPLNPVLAMSRLGTRRSLGRIPAFTVGLEMDESAKRKLPATTKGAIQNYLRDHRLAIEPTVYESEDGDLYFGTDCRAAFYKPASPSSTVEAEPMIDEAIGRFRALGVLGSPLAGDGRTLLMAFRYIKTSERLTSVSGALETETELLFLHLAPDATPQRLEFSAFVTTEERQKLHKLDIGRAVLRQSTPTITASIRFDSFTMMGMYPAEPVVTGVRHQTAGSMPVSNIRILIDNKSTTEQLTFEDVLDRFSELSRRSDVFQ